MTQAHLAITPGALAILDAFGPAFSTATDPTALLLLECAQEADALVTARERRARFHVVR